MSERAIRMTRKRSAIFSTDVIHRNSNPVVKAKISNADFKGRLKSPLHFEDWRNAIFVY